MFRFTDFLVFEVDLDGNVTNLKFLGNPGSSSKGDAGMTSPTQPEHVPKEMEGFPNVHTTAKDLDSEGSGGASSQKLDSPGELWPEHFNTALAPFLDEERIGQLKKMYLEGRDPPRMSDSGWAGRKAKTVDEGSAMAEPVEPTVVAASGKDNKRGMRGKQSGRGDKPEDNRKVTSQVRFNCFNFLISSLMLFVADLVQRDENCISQSHSRVIFRQTRNRNRYGCGRLSYHREMGTT